MKPPSQTRDRLLHTAVDLIWRQSYRAISVDDICRDAGVNKGSFYHAFKTKSELAVTAFEAHWNAKRPVLDAIFSSQNPPLERLERYCDAIVRDQSERHAQVGKVLGCPFCAVGSELSTQDDAIRRKAEEMSDRVIRYLAGALCDAAAHGSLSASVSPERLAREISYYVTGILMQAKIRNDLAVLDGLKPGVFHLLGRQPVGVAA